MFHSDYNYILDVSHSTEYQIVIFLQQHLAFHRSPDAAILVGLELFLGQLF